MSHPIGKTGSRVRTGGLVVLCLGILLFIASALVPASGAYFNDTKSGHATITTSTIGLSLANGDGTSANGSFDLSFANLTPNSMAMRTFTATNTGSLAGTLMMYSDATLTGGSGYDMSQLSYTVDGYGSIPLTSGYHPPLNLGTLAAHETRTFTVTANLDRYAGNEWQGVTIDNTLGVFLTQS